MSELGVVTPEQWTRLTPQQQASQIAQFGPPPAHWGATTTQPPQQVVVVQKRRRIWPWVMLAFVLVPVLFFVACTAFVGTAVNSVDQARKGGTVKIGETFTYASGLALTVSAPKPYKSSNPYIVDKSEAGYEATVTIRNGTKNPVGASLITMNVTVNNAPAERVFEGVDLPTQDIAVGQQLQVPLRFKVKKGTTGPLQVAVTDTFNEPVFFNGTL
jgi:hypothetical protein